MPVYVMKGSSMIAIVSFVILFLSCVTIFNDIQLDLRKNHSRTYIKKTNKGFFNKVLFLPFVKEINKIKYGLLIISYGLAILGFVLQALLTFNILSDGNTIVLFLFRIMIAYSVVLFIYKMLINRILVAMNESKSVFIVLMLIVIFIYVVIFIVVPILGRLITQ